MNSETGCQCRCYKQKKVPLRVSVTSAFIFNKERPDSSQSCNRDENGIRCNRCGSSMLETQSVAVSIQLPQLQAQTCQSNTSIGVQSKCTESSMSLESVPEVSCGECGLPISIHGDKFCQAEESNVPGLTILSSDFSEEEDLISSSECNFELHQDALQSGSLQQEKMSSDLSLRSLEFTHEITSTPCADCHVALLNEHILNVHRTDQEVVTLMLQVPRPSHAKQSVECQTDCDFTRLDVGVGVNFLGMYPGLNFNSGYRDLPRDKIATPMAPLLPYMHCRFCGTRLKRAEVDEHERACLEKSEEEVNRGTEQDKGPSVRKETKAVTPKTKKPAKGGREKQTNVANKNTKKPSAEDTTSDDESPSTSQGQPAPRSPENDQTKCGSPPEKTISKEEAYPKVSSKMLQQSKESQQDPPSSRDSLPMNAVVKDEPKQAWNANLAENVSGKLKDPFPPVKKYRHYPVSCEFCNKKFQPGRLRRHIQKYHPDAHMAPGARGRDKGRIRPPNAREEKEAEKKAVGIPRQLKICYICGRMFGSKSIKIHEPKCLEKWKIENDRLPKGRRMPEPIKPQPLTESTKGEPLPGQKKRGPNLPEMDAEAEAAYRCHLKNLVPCQHCGRTFNPDRIMVHESVCIERAGQRRRRVRRRG